MTIAHALRARAGSCALTALVIALGACASASKASTFDSGKGGDDAAAGDDGSGSGASGNGGTASSGGNWGASGSSGGGFGDLGDGGTTSREGGDEGGRAQTCTDAGCTCIRIASIGHEGVWGACGQGGDTTSALVNWLNTQSTAAVDTYDTSKPTLSADFLARYDVILLQWLRDVPDGGGEGSLWQFSPAEVSALAAWVNAGGGLIVLSGYDGDGAEVTPENTLLSFTAFSYDMDSTYGSDQTGGSCWGGASGLTGWNTSTPIGAHLTEVGIQFGRSISVAADAGSQVTVDCPCGSGNSNACAAHEDLGKGHVFVFTDEWVTYTSQWAGTSPCISSSCTTTPKTAFQVPQFWYNAIEYASSSVKCFTIDEPGIVY